MKQHVSAPRHYALLPVTGSSYPFGAANRQNIPTDLSAFGYLEEEYRIAGTSNVYTWPEWQKYPDIQIPDAPYCTRILVRKPADPAKFSGNVFVELFNWAHYYDRPIAGWGQCAPYYLECGDAWVGITCRARCIESLQNFDPQRYGRLSFANPRPAEERGPVIFDYDETDADTENGLIWDMISQVGVLLRGSLPGSPFCGYQVQALLGCAATGGDLSAYAAAVHPISCREGGKPIYDGFLIFMTGAPGSLNSEEDKLNPLDNRCKIYSEVPVMRVYTADDMLGKGHHPDWACMQRRLDSDHPGEQFRSYELSGTGRINTYQDRWNPCEEDVRKAGREIRKNRAGDLSSHVEYPLRYALCSCYDNLKKWVRDGIVPPHGAPFAMRGTYPDVDFVFDALHIPEGGVRLPCVEVPLGYYTPGSSGFPAEKFDEATIRRLYPSKHDYLEKLIDQTIRCVQQRWLLPQHAKELLLEAFEVEFPK